MTDGDPFLQPDSPTPDASASDAEFAAALDEQGLRTRVERPDEGEWGWTPWRVLASLGLVCMVGFWVWAFSPLAPRGHPDEMDNDAFARRAETRCAAAVDEIDRSVAPAFEATSAADRADQIQASTDILAGLTADLATFAPDPATRDGDLVMRWLADWNTYLTDRYAYAADFRAGRDEAFSVTVVAEGQVTDPIDSFAAANKMRSCAAPTDV